MARPGVGYRMARALVLPQWEREFGPLNAKRVYRVWKSCQLAKPTKRRKKRHTGQTVPLATTGPHQVWCLDFCHDACLNGDRFKVLALKDEYTRLCLALEVETHLDSQDVRRVVERAIKQYGAPDFLRSDNGRSLSPIIWESGSKHRAPKPASLHPVRPGKMATRKVLWRDYAPNVSMPKSFTIWPRPNSNWRSITTTTITSVLTRRWAI